jgi:CarD family transcriptional regulator
MTSVRKGLENIDLTAFLEYCSRYSSTSVPPPKGASMNHDFHIGDKVVYPNHGVGIVEQISSRTIGSMVQKYYELHIKASNLRVTIPFSNVAAVGLRRVIKSADIDQILDILVSSKCENHADWKFRFKENSEKMRTGSLLDVAYVLKSLLVLNQTKALSFREKKMLERARYLLVSEMAMARNVEEIEMEGLLNRALAKVKLKFPEVTADA